MFAVIRSAWSAKPDRGIARMSLAFAPHPPARPTTPSTPSSTAPATPSPPAPGTTARKNRLQPPDTGTGLQQASHRIRLPGPHRQTANIQDDHLKGLGDAEVGGEGEAAKFVASFGSSDRLGGLCRTGSPSQLGVSWPGPGRALRDSLLGRGREDGSVAAHRTGPRGITE